MESPTPYDDVRYSGWPYPQAQPDRLATLARLFGMQPADPAGARVLELGCGDGANLMPVAYAWPAARVVGIDLSASAIAGGQRTGAQLGLRNLDLRVGDLSRLPEDLGEFDYVIAHGVYSWVPEPVRGSLLDACHRHLAPQGVAFVSYNVLPGGHLRRMLREMLLMHAEELEDPPSRVAAARDLLAFLRDATAVAAARPAAAALADEVRRLSGRGDDGLFHDDLSPEFHLCHFRDFVERCEERGLQFLAEADYFEMSDGGLAPAARERLAALGGDLVAREQYLDFAKVRRFRQSLLCRGEVALRDAGATAIRTLALASQAQPVDGDRAADGAAPGAERRFGTRAGAGFTTNNPLLTAAAELLSREWPKAIAFEDAFAASTARAGVETTEARRAQLAEFALRSHAAGAIELHAFQPLFERWPGPKPRASALACLQSSAGPTVTNLVGMSVSLDEPRARRLLLRLDGRRDRGQLLREFRGSPQELEEDLETLGRLALLLPAD